ncbi:ATP-dependent DNA helicase RecQ [Enterococcus sp. BWB1-3]|uniref:RecQ family ATP-dependent DNA helicase n=1 Tax=Enterococcus sp. BWB1-3 TaxID=2787713 RepID=UPI001922E0B9|nr:ATP-dependent DNA helicase RecQ [Enterococcus sp. BWB1-3]MBL1228603.1 ATP-dependent DNA helicase RecQ [Enterococcus sp. BWB1-3]
MDLKKILNLEFGFSNFREGQEEIISSLLQQKNTFAVLPTGTGKSLCYQFAGRMLEGTVLVVSPLISLMDDQVRQLQKSGERSVIAFNSSLSYSEKKHVSGRLSDYKYLFISPESLMNESVMQKLKQMKLALFVIDEAHCVSQWGVDFRPEYVKIKDVLKILGFPLTLALTATASDSVKEEIRQHLFQENIEIQQYFYSVNRNNISLSVEMTEDKDAVLFKFLDKFNQSGIIYCTSRKTTERISCLINEKLGIRTAFYHGGLSTAERGKIQQQFVDNDIQLLCATNAFGMGIDKPDIRLILHYDCSASLENYVQEIGRAGRDGMSSQAVLLYRHGDEFIHYFFQNEVTEELKILQRLVQSEMDFSEGLFNSLSEIQQKWLEGYLNGSYTFDQLRKRLIEKRIERQYQLHQMLEYIQTKNCRRIFVMDYFSEKGKVGRKDSCCDNCGLEFPTAENDQKLSESPANTESGWQEILIRLFKVNE